MWVFYNVFYRGGFLWSGNLISFWRKIHGFFFFSFPFAFQNLCQELETKFYEGTFNWESVKQHDAASLLKLFVRELPQPLLSVEYLKAFQAVQCKWQLLKQPWCRCCPHKLWWQLSSPRSRTNIWMAIWTRWCSWVLTTTPCFSCLIHLHLWVNR